LPIFDVDFDTLVKAMPNVEFHFAIEGMKGSGKDFLNSVSQEVKIFNRCELINANNFGWLELQKLNRSF
jgi:hypothetical protein